MKWRNIMKFRPIILACFGVFVAISAVFAVRAYAQSRTQDVINYGDPMPHYVFAYCEANNRCPGPNDWVYYQVSQSNNWNQIAMTKLYTYLTNGDRAFCSLVVECSDGSYEVSNQVGGGTCSVTCPSGTYAQTIYAEDGVT